MTRIRQIVSLGLLGTLACSRAATRRAGEGPFCTAPPHPRAASALSAGDGSRRHPSPDEVARRFAGTWDVLLVGTEGVGTSAVRRTLRLLPTDSGARTACPLGRCPARLSFPAAGQFLDRGTAFDSIAAVRHRMREVRDAEVRYDAELGTVELWTGPPGNEAGSALEVSSISDSAFAGRWGGGGIVVMEVKRGDVTTYEHDAGYFCARRLGR